MQILNLAGTKDNKEVSGNKIICNSSLATICMTSINHQLYIWLQMSLFYAYHVENRTEIENEIAFSRYKVPVCSNTRAIKLGTCYEF